MELLRGTPVSPGAAIGHAVVISAVEITKEKVLIGDSEVTSEISRLDGALKKVSEELSVLEARTKDKVGEEEAAIFEAQRMMLEDPTLRSAIETKIRGSLIPADRASHEACEDQAKALEEINDEYLASRALDVRDIGKRLVLALLGVCNTMLPVSLAEDSILVAPDLSPSDTASLNVGKVAAIVLDKGGRTSHTAIIARSLGIPAVVATEKATALIRDGDVVAVDAESGQVCVSPDETALTSLRRKAGDFAIEKKRLEDLRGLSSITRDGKTVELAVNIGNAADARSAVRVGADGVGLFRTEFLFIDRSAMPDEEEQFKAYSEVLKSLAPRPVVIRTLDIGGDKNVPFLGLPREENPFLGLRAIRLCLANRDLFRSQLRALLRASVYGNLRIMFPMISDLAELRQAKEELRLAKESLRAQGIRVSPDIQVGIMVEVPSAAVNADLLAPECDFFSIGTNDLVQYTMASDRGNPAVSYLGDPFNPAVLRLVKRTIDEGHKQGIWVGMCGEMAGMRLAIPLLVGMGLDELSMAPGSVPHAKETIRSLDSEAAKSLWVTVSKMKTADEIKSYLGSV